MNKKSRLEQFTDMIKEDFEALPDESGIDALHGRQEEVTLETLKAKLVDFYKTNQAEHEIEELKAELKAKGVTDEDLEEIKSEAVQTAEQEESEGEEEQEEEVM